MSLILVLAGIAAASAPAASADVVLNEINCEGTDWVELVNTSADPADISGWLLTDEALDLPQGDEHLYEFGPGTVVAPNGDVVVERTTDFQFGISCGDQLILGDAEAGPVAQTTIGPRNNATDAWGRYPNGTGPFAPTLPTPGEPNEPSTGDGEPPPDLAGWIYDPATVVEIELTAPQSSLDALEQTPEEYQPATFSLTTAGASYGPLDVGLRLKGGLAPSRPLSAKAAFKLKFGEFVTGQRFLGLKKLTLNNMVQDSSMLAETLTYALYRGAGVPAPRTGFAYVALNGQEYGLYLNVEQPDDVLLARWFPTTQHLYEGEYGDDATPGSAGLFELDEGPESQRDDLEAMIAAVNEDWPDWSDGVAPFLDLEQMTTMWAVEKWVGQVDGYSSQQGPGFPNNYFLHSDASGRFTMLPWGADYTWVQAPDFGRPGGILFERCLGDPSCLALYVEALRALPRLAAELELGRLASSTAALLEPWQQRDPRREYSMGEIEAAVAHAQAFLAARPGHLADWLWRPGGSPAGAPRTTITLRPPRRTRARRLRVEFAPSHPRARFECRLNRGRFRGCASPLLLKLRPGHHRLAVRAIGPGGEVEPSPATIRFRILDRAGRDAATDRG